MDKGGRATIIFAKHRSITSGAFTVQRVGAILGPHPLIVTGAGGKLGRILQAGWALGRNLVDGSRASPLWIARKGRGDVFWDMGAQALPDSLCKILPKGAVVLHLAGVTQGDEAQLQANIDLLGPLLELCARSQARRLIFLSTAAVYSSGSLRAESAAVAPASAYGRSKAQAEALLRDRATLALTLLRLGNLAGADALLGRPAPEKILLDQVGGHAEGPLRSWIGARAFVQAIQALCQMELPSILNLAQEPPLRMGALLDAAGLDWQAGSQMAAVPEATLDLSLLQSILPLPPASPGQIAAEAAWARQVLA
ncbi:NAD-dependent epimerase/dehydratase family protein [Xinfangfangia sp. CPCC 101601]|uniref:NAD-dependent epimerase/dehydratase family protein n=1 Tax=Pseudogemmobacter lacusdianii TaxID=3069608 RepID=A0ABU0VTT7_9RHOB|nr:NAD-dependent epimerase/dehydratase family protein [Xinfangfangia sp. CPCC 101601]MDQ2065144.1 NAD-dependent epimerase/dehydratase family protein [Xinfangfangia sp. CPCC 101601]